MPPQASIQATTCPACTLHRPDLESKRSKAAWEAGNPGITSPTSFDLLPDLGSMPELETNPELRHVGVCTAFLNGKLDEFQASLREI